MESQPKPRHKNREAEAVSLSLQGRACDRPGGRAASGELDLVQGELCLHGLPSEEGVDESAGSGTLFVHAGSLPGRSLPSWVPSGVCRHVLVSVGIYRYLPVDVGILIECSPTAQAYSACYLVSLRSCAT